MVSEICSQFWIEQTFTAAYHPASKGFERANRKVLEVLSPIVNELLNNWEDWLSHVGASLNSSVNYSTGKSVHYILYGVEKRLPYDLLTSSQQPVYNTDNYTQQQLGKNLGKFWENHSSVRSKFKATKTEMMANQHKRAIPINFKQIHSHDTAAGEKVSLWVLTESFAMFMERNLKSWNQTLTLPL